LQQELGVLVDAVVVHAAAGVPPRLVAQVELVMLGHEARRSTRDLRRPCAFQARRWLRVAANVATGTRKGSQARQPSQYGR